jgi:RHS repeat-associated protein
MAMWPWRRSAKPKPDKGSDRRRPGSRQGQPPPSFEQLEDRVAPATLTQLGGAAGTGTTTANVVAVTGTTTTNAVTVTAPGVANLVTHLVLPSALGNHNAATLYVQYSNTGTAALPAPLLTLTATQVNSAGVAVSQALLTLDPSLAAEGITTASLPAGFGHSIQILASGATGGVLQPGESETVPVYWVGWQQPWNPSNPPFQFNLTVNQASDTTAINWASLQNSLRPASISAAAWSVLYSGMISRFGTTTGSYVQELDSDAAYLGMLGESVYNVSQLWNFEIEQGVGFSILPDLAAGIDVSLPAPGIPLVFSRTYSNTILGRSQTGPLGYGWFDNWQTTLSVVAGGTVILQGEGGTQREFLSNGAGGYSAQPGDFGTLTAPAGTNPDYLLREQNGIVTAFRPNGTIDYVRDADGNTIRAGYAANGRLVSLTASSGQALQIAYNGAGLIASVTDSTGGRTTYAYDSTNHYLLSVTGSDGRTVSYTYNTAANSPSSGALLSVAYPDGTHDLFTYDAQGRLSTTAHDGGQEKETYTYGSGGLLSVTDANGNTSQYFFDGRALIKTVDPLGNATVYSLDANLNLVAVTNALGQTTSNTYDANGYLTSSTDPAGNTVAYSYTSFGSFEEPSSVLDANGNTTSYQYDAQGNLLAIAYPDTSTQQFSYDPLGDLIGSVDPNGQPTSYAYNANGQVTAESFADGSSIANTYDTSGNLLTATEITSSGTVLTTSFTYATASNELVKITYPGNLFLEFSYDAGGRRTQSVDQSGFTVNYHYDAVGRLAQLTDGNGNLIVSYTYDPAGRLIEKDLGNGTYTTYQYDGAGNLAQLINYGPRPQQNQDGPINSSFAYSYDALGRMTSMTTLAGEWTYNYDAAGELAHAAFASANSTVTPNQDLEYLYDPAGNRTATIVNGVTTSYTVNNRNEYVSAGSTAFTYDDNGNLTSATDADGTTTYSYNAANQLTGVTGPDGTTYTYTYDALGDPIGVTTNDQTTAYLYDPIGLGYVVGAYTTGGGTVADYTYGLGLTSQVTSSGASYYDFDASGSTVGLTGTSGSYVDQYSYLPFGEIASSSGSLANPFTFQGQSGALGNGNGSLVMGARGYVPNLGRFLSADPLGITGGSPNLVEYAANDPLNLTQASGLTVMSANLWDAGAAHAAIEADGQYFAKFAVPESRQGDLFDAPLQASYWSRGQEHAPASQTLSLQVPDDMGQAMIARTQEMQTQNTYQLWNGVADALRTGAESVPGNVYLPGSLNVFLHSAWYVSVVNSLLGLGSGAGTTGTSNDVVTWDADSVIGTVGYGTQNFVSAGTLLAYRVSFENLPNATAPAQEVTVTDQLDPGLDWSTLQFTEVGFGNTLIALPAGIQNYQTTVPMTWNGETFEVEIQLSFNPASGLIVAVFQSIDPDTDLPPDLMAGFLPPEDGSGRGMGHIGFTVLPRLGLVSGTQIRNVAFVTIDDNPSVRTDQVNDANVALGINPNKQALVTIDSGPPVAGVTPLPVAEGTSSFAITWTGQDFSGSGIAFYDVYYSDNGGTFQQLLQHTKLTTTTFHGTSGHTYTFYSIATDNVGYVQAAVASPPAITTVRLATTTTVTSSSVNNLSTFGQAVTFTARMSATDPAAAISALAGETVVFMDGLTVLGSRTLNSSGVATFTTTTPLTPGSHIITAAYVGDSKYQASTGVLRNGQAVNRALPTFTHLTTSRTISAGTSAMILSGYLTAGAAIPVGENVVMAVGGVSMTATIKSDGSFSAVITTSGLAASTGAYTIVYSYAGDSNFNSVSNTSTSLTVTASPYDVTNRTSVRLGSFQWVAGSNSKSKYNYLETVTVTNTSGATLAGPICLELVGLTGATLYNASGTSKIVNPKSPYLLLSSASLLPGASLTVTLDFYDPPGTLPMYTTRVISGGAP